LTFLCELRALEDCNSSIQTSGNAFTVTLTTLASRNAYRNLVDSAIASAPKTYYEAHLLPETNTAGVEYTGLRLLRTDHTGEELRRGDSRDLPYT
jgi:hypothetical protein